MDKRLTNPSKLSRTLGPLVSSIDGEDTEAGVLSTLLQHKTALLHSRKDPHCYKTGPRSMCPRPLQQDTESISEETTTPSWTKTPPPSVTSKRTENTDRQSSSCPEPHSPKDLSLEVPENTCKFTFTIKMGHINPSEAEFCVFKQNFILCWSSVDNALGALTKLLRAYAVPVAVVKGEQLVELVHSRDSEWRGPPPVSSLLLVLQNWEEVLEVLSLPGQHFRGEGGTEAAAVHIQSCWRRYKARSAYLLHCRRKWAAGTIAISWLMHAQMCRVRKALQARRFSQLENQRLRAQHLAANWNHIRASKRTIIHIPSLGYSHNQRHCLRDFNILQNIQMGRLCDIRDENVEVIYVSPLLLSEDVLKFYSGLLQSNRTSDVDTAGANENSLSKRRFIIFTPEALDYFPSHSMCLSTLLQYSPRTLQRIRRLIQGKHAYIVPGLAHIDDLAVADQLSVPLLGPEPAVAQLYGTKSGGRRIFSAAGVEVPPGAKDIYSLNQLHEALAELLAQNLDVQRWLFKMDDEHGGHGTAFCDVSHMICYAEALSEYRRYGADAWRNNCIRESVVLRFLKEVPEWLSCYARPAKTSHYPTWAGFLQTFLRQGGVVEAYPPSDAISCVTVDLLLEPGGQVTMLSSGDQLRSSCGLNVLGSSVPQRSLNPETLQSICARVGQACKQQDIVGHVSMDVACFIHCTTKKQTVWALDLDLCYSDHLAMTQMLLLTTKATLNCQTSSLQVPMPNTEKSSQKVVVEKRCAVMSSKLFHTNLSMLYRSVFFKMCHVRGIRYITQKNQGTVFALYDSSDRQRIGMITVSESPEGALVTFAHNLSVIHQEISSSRTQGETNFKELIKEIEDFLQKHKLQAVVNKKAPV